MPPSDVPPMKKGYLLKLSRSGVIKNWKMRFFVLDRGTITYFENDSSLNVPPYGEGEKGKMHLLDAHVEEPKASNMKRLVVTGNGTEKNMTIEANSVDEAKGWVDAIRRHCDYASGRYKARPSAGGTVPPPTKLNDLNLPRSNSKSKNSDEKDDAPLFQRKASNTGTENWITPEPLFVVKVRDAATHAKVFINICQHKDVPQSSAPRGTNKWPYMISSPCKMLVDEKSEEGAGSKDVKVYDIVVNKQVGALVSDSVAKVEIVNKAIRHIRKYYGEDLDEDAKFPKIKNNYKGELCRIQVSGSEAIRHRGSSLARSLSLNSQPGESEVDSSSSSGYLTRTLSSRPSNSSGGSGSQGPSGSLPNSFNSTSSGNSLREETEDAGFGSTSSSFSSSSSPNTKSNSSNNNTFNTNRGGQGMASTSNKTNLGGKSVGATAASAAAAVASAVASKKKELVCQSCSKGLQDCLCLEEYYSPSSSLNMPIFDQQLAIPRRLPIPFEVIRSHSIGVRLRWDSLKADKVLPSQERVYVIGRCQMEDGSIWLRTLDNTFIPINADGRRPGMRGGNDENGDSYFSMEEGEYIMQVEPNKRTILPLALPAPKQIVIRTVRMVEKYLQSSSTWSMIKSFLFGQDSSKSEVGQVTFQSLFIIEIRYHAHFVPPDSSNKKVKLTTGVCGVQIARSFAEIMSFSDNLRKALRKVSPNVFRHHSNMMNACEHLESLHLEDGQVEHLDDALQMLDFINHIQSFFEKVIEYMFDGPSSGKSAFSSSSSTPSYSSSSSSSSSHLAMPIKVFQDFVAPNPTDILLMEKNLLSFRVQTISDFLKRNNP